MGGVKGCGGGCGVCTFNNLRRSSKTNKHVEHLMREQRAKGTARSLMNQLVSSVKKDVFSTDGGFRLSPAVCFFFYLSIPSAQETSFLPGRDLSPSPEINLHADDRRQDLPHPERLDRICRVRNTTAASRVQICEGRTSGRPLQERRELSTQILPRLHFSISIALVLQTYANTAWHLLKCNSSFEPN